MRARFVEAVRRSGEVRKLTLFLSGTKITTAASMRELWGAVWQGNAATLEELEIWGYKVSEQSYIDLGYNNGNHRMIMTIGPEGIILLYVLLNH